MNFFYDLNTRAKLLLSFAIIIVLNLIILTTSINSMIYNQGVATTLNEVLIGSFGRITAVQTAAADTNNKITKALNAKNSTYNTPDLLREMDQLLSTMDTTANAVRGNKFARTDYVEGCKKLVQLTRDAAQVVREHVVPVLRQGDDENSMAVFATEAAPLFTEIARIATDILKIQNEECVKLSLPMADATPIYVDTGLAAFSTLIAIFLAFFISSYIAKAIAEQIEIVEGMAAGDFSLHITQGHKDEFGRTHTALRKMRIALNDIIIQTKRECIQLQEEMRNLQGMSNSIASSSGNVENQALTVSAASDEMVSTTQDIARNCESAANSSTTCKDISDNGLHQVIEAVNSIREQSEHTKDNAQKIESLAQQTRAIGSIVNTIDDIASQTNLLALNAAIEAARAGEAGRGFAVVADEVRALASRTTASTQEISKMVKSIQDEASLATESINTSVANMEAVAEKASRTEELLQDITHHVIEVNQQITQIATAAEQQTSATSEISMNMQHITASTSDMTANANQQNSSMDAAYNNLGKLIKALEFFKTRE